MGNKNAITYKELFPLIKENKIWLGYTSISLDILFKVPKEMELELLTQKEGSSYRLINNEIFARSASVWFTNIDHNRRHQPLKLMTMADNLKFNKKLKGQTEYYRYDNYDAIEIPFTEVIPSDYEGVMGVPISFLDKYCPEQFEIVGITKTWYGGASKVYPEQIQFDKSGKSSKVTKLNDGPAIQIDDIAEYATYYQVSGKTYIQTYARILIRHKEKQ